jgi:phage portal protein BeeE
VRWYARLAEYLLRDAMPPTPSLPLVYFGEAGGVAPYGVNEANALGLSAIYRCVSIIAGAVAVLPWGEWRGTLELPPSRLVDRPMASLTRREWAWRVTATMALYNVAYLRHVGGTDSEGVPASLVPVPPANITPPARRAPGDFPGSLTTYQIGAEQVDAALISPVRRGAWPDTGDQLGGLLQLARMSWAGALSAEGYASRYWQAGGAPTTVISTEAELTTGQADDIAGRWRDRRAQGPDWPAVLGKGASASPYGADPLTESAVEARRELVADVGRAFGVPSFLLNAPAGDSQTYRTTESEGMAFVRYTLADYIAAIEDLLSDLLPGARVMRMSTALLTRGEQQARYTAWQSALGAGWMTVDEVRAAEGLGPLEPAAEPLPSQSLARSGTR